MLQQMKELFLRHPNTTIIWAHIGVGRVVRPLDEQLAIVEKLCTEPALSHVYMDISWDEVAKYATASPEASHKVLKGNHERLFDQARSRVRASWDVANVRSGSKQ